MGWLVYQRNAEEFLNAEGAKVSQRAQKEYKKYKKIYSIKHPIEVAY
jgi:cytidylate kinase